MNDGRRAMARKSAKEIGRRLKSKSNRHDFDLSSMASLSESEYSSLITRIMAHLNSLTPDELKTEFDIYLFKNQHQVSLNLQKAKPAEILTLGKFCWILNQGGTLSEFHQNDFQSRLRKLEHSLKKQKTAIIPEKKTSIRKSEVDYTVLGLLDTMLDQHRYAEKLDFMHNMSTELAKEIKAVFTEYKKEQSKISTDEFLKDAYSHWSALTLRRRLRFIDQVLMNCDIQKTLTQQTKRARRIEKIQKKTTATKPSDLQKIVKNFRYLSKFEEIDGVSPIRIHGASTVLLYDTDRRAAILFVSDSSGLIINGAAIAGYDERKSFSKNIRKPDEFLAVAKGLTTPSKVIQLMKSIKSKEGRLPVRGTERTLILKAFTK